MTLTSQDVTKAIAIMQRFIPFFPPADDLTVGYLQREIESFVSTAEQLEWLTQTACRVMKSFSIAELRGIYCSRYAPKDGQYTAAETPGFTLEESVNAAERAYHEREAAEYERKAIAWKEEAKRLGAPAPEPFVLPENAVKALPLATEPAPRKTPLRELEARLKDESDFASRRTPEESARLIAMLDRELRSQAQ